MQLLDNPQGGYRFLTGVAPFSSGVIAMPGYEIVHVVVRRLLPYRQGFGQIARHLEAEGRPRQALCAVELRSPHPLSFEGFADFNRGYIELLATWDIPVNGHNPVARTNVAPEIGALPEAVLYGFSYTRRASEGRPATFVVAGSGDQSHGQIVRAGETTPDAIRDKAKHVLRTQQARLSGLGASWSDVTAVDVYTVHPLHDLVPGVLLPSLQQAAGRGVHWYYSRPPILGLEFEMDMRGVDHELRLE
jgi:hypothetical protein